MKIRVRKYRCKHCGLIVKRKSDKQWIKSMCDRTGKMVRLQLVNKK